MEEHRSLHRVARVAGSALSAIWLFILLAPQDHHVEVEEESSFEGILLSILAVSAIVGFAVSFRRRRLGGALTVFIGCLLCLFATWSAGRNQWLAVSVSGVPWIVVGAALLRGD